MTGPDEMLTFLKAALGTLVATFTLEPKTNLTRLSGIVIGFKANLISPALADGAAAMFSIKKAQKIINVFPMRLIDVYRQKFLFLN